MLSIYELPLPHNNLNQGTKLGYDMNIFFSTWPFFGDFIRDNVYTFSPFVNLWCFIPGMQFGTHDVVVLKPNKADPGSPALGQGVVYRLKVLIVKTMFPYFTIFLFRSIIMVRFLVVIILCARWTGLLNHCCF